MSEEIKAGMSIIIAVVVLFITPLIVLTICAPALIELGDYLADELRNKLRGRK